MKTLLTKLNKSQTVHQTKKTPTTKAFTLLEMLLVIAIIVILLGGVMFETDPCNDSDLPHAENVACWSTVQESKAWGPMGVKTEIQDENDGRANTVALLSRPEAFPAAEYCVSLNNQKHGGHNDWYLPAKNELWTAWNATGSTARDVFADDNYWSSTEFSDWPENLAWFLGTDGDDMISFDKNCDISVRCLR